MHLNKDTRLQNGKYTILEFLGQGGFGITYKAETSDGQIVAIKEFFMKDSCMRGDDSKRITVSTESARTEVERYRQKFIKEANNLLRLDHPNIVKVYDVFKENDTDYFVMQYMAGGSLRDYVLSHGPMDEPTAKNYILQVASALDYMHMEKHLCHYDVKPGNIMLDGGKAMLIDFGLSKNYDTSGQQTSTTPVGISAGYAPIEQYQQSLQEFSPATDIYALGATLYFLLSGQNPPEASVVLERGLTCPVQMSQNTWAVITQAMQPVRFERFQMVSAFSQALSNDETVIKPDIGQVNEIHGSTVEYPQPHKNKSLLWVVAALLALLLVIALVLLNKKEQAVIPDVNVPEQVVEEEMEETVDLPFATKYVHKTTKIGQADVEVTFDYPTQGPQQLVEAIRSLILENLNGENVSSYTGDLSDGDALADYYARQYASYYSSDVDLKEYPAELEFRFKKLSETDKFITYEVYLSEYCGGAIHGMYMSTGVTFKKSNGSVVTDIIRNTSDPAFKKIVIDEVLSKINSSLEDITAYFKNDFNENPLPQSGLFLSERGVELRYQPYEIASYGDGIIEVSLPWWEIKDYLTDEAKSLVDTAN